MIRAGHLGPKDFQGRLKWRGVGIHCALELNMVGTRYLYFSSRFAATYSKLREQPNVTQMYELSILEIANSRPLVASFDPCRIFHPFTC